VDLMSPEPKQDPRINIFIERICISSNLANQIIPWPNPIRNACNLVFLYFFLYNL